MSTIGLILEKRAVNKITGHKRKLNPLTLAVAGLTSLTAAAFTYETWSGLVALGISCFILEWRIGE